MPQLRCHGLCFQKRVLQMPHEERWNKGTVPNWDIHDDDDDDDGDDDADYADDNDDGDDDYADDEEEEEMNTDDGDQSC